MLNRSNVKAAQSRSALGHVNELGDLWRRVEILSIDEAPHQMTAAIENVGGAAALTRRIVELRPVLEGVNRDALSVDLRDP
jgi:hypothetical protein